MSYTITRRFQPVSAKAERRGKCPTCGKTTRRSRTFEHTVNPYNRNADGSIKTFVEVLADVQAKADAWQPEPAIFEHGACVDAREAAEETR
jgi:hypothetical protein